MILNKIGAKHNLNMIIRHDLKFKNKTMFKL